MQQNYDPIMVHSGDFGTSIFHSVSKEESSGEARASLQHVWDLTSEQASCSQQSWHRLLERLWPQTERFRSACLDYWPSPCQRGMWVSASLWIAGKNHLAPGFGRWSRSDLSSRHSTWAQRTAPKWTLVFPDSYSALSYKMLSCSDLPTEVFGTARNPQSCLLPLLSHPWGRCCGRGWLTFRANSGRMNAALWMSEL